MNADRLRDRTDNTVTTTVSWQTDCSQGWKSDGPADCKNESEAALRVNSDRAGYQTDTLCKNESEAALRVNSDMSEYQTDTLCKNDSESG